MIPWPKTPEEWQAWWWLLKALLGVLSIFGLAAVIQRFWGRRLGLLP